jgi:hypothetical protein
MDGALVVFDAGGWMQVTPREGWQVYVQDEADFCHYKSSQWYLRDGRTPNLLINGAFQIWQRGLTFAAPGKWRLSLRPVVGTQPYWHRHKIL